MVSLMGFGGIDSDSEYTRTVALPYWLRIIRVFSAILSNWDEGMFNLLIERNGRPNEA